jgi:caffeoyl-CoA O-methyltransferase
MMATVPTHMTEAIAEYAETFFSSETPELNQLLNLAKSKGIPDISIGGVQGSFLQTMVRLLNAKVIVEIGSLAGYSAITMALAMNEGGKVHCFERDTEYCDFIVNQSRAIGIIDKIEIHEGNALEMLPSSEVCDIDMVFIDADKPSYTTYMELLIPRLRSGGIIIGDNALAWGYIAEEHPQFEPENVKGIQAFNQSMRVHKDLYPPCIIPLGDGMCMSVKK